MKNHIFYILVLLIIIILHATAYAAPAFFVTTANVNIRTEPTTDSEVVVLVHRDILVLVTDFRDHDWYAVEYNGHRGYMKAEFLTEHGQALAAPEPEAAYVPEPVVEYIPEPVIETAPEPEPVVYQEIENPVHITEAPPEAPPEIVSEDIPLASVEALPNMDFVTTANVNLRQSPGLDGLRILTVPRGSTVYVTDFHDGEWFAVTYNGRVGYMTSEFLIDAANAPKFEMQVANTSIGSVELINWSQAKNNVIKSSTTYKIIDVRSRTSYNVRIFSQGNHADVDPATAADSEALKKAFNNKWSWTTRPILVIIGDKAYAASINGMPHGGSNVKGNNVNGHFCIHFKESRTHNGSRVHERDHQNSVQEAFNTASKW